jgi:hypothetical protein
MPTYLETFEASPTKVRHASYDNSIFAGTAPEHSTGEVLLGSAYRKLVLGIDDKQVDLNDVLRLTKARPGQITSQALWENMLLGKGGVRSPVKPGQTGAQPGLQLMPIVPSAARVACVLGQRMRNRWEPSNLLVEAIGAARGPVEGGDFARAFAAALAIGPDDDIFARLLDAEILDSLAQLDLSPPGSALDARLGSERARSFRNSVSKEILSPAERFCCDLESVILLKQVLTRRQWTVLVESVLRLGLGMHALWVCHINWVAWQIVLRVASGATIPTDQELEKEIWESHYEQRPLLEIGAPATELFARLIENYAYGRLGLNILFHKMQDANVPWSGGTIGLSANPANGAIAQIRTFLNHIAVSRSAIDPTDAGAWLKKRLCDLFDQSSDLRQLAKCKSTWSRNLIFFARHSLGQIETKDPELRSYDQSYLVASAGRGRPLRVQPGPAMLITLVHACCKSQHDLPVSLDDFRRHLAAYGLRVPGGELAGGRTGGDLEKLGLVVDSPDAAGGRLLVPPF